MALRLRRPPWWTLVVVAAVLVIDQATKAAVLAAADRLPATVWRGVRLEIVRNTGVSFSLFTGRGWLVTLMVGLIVLVLLVLFVTLPRRYSLPLALLLGGSIGNLIDRFRVGYVVDFVAVYWWPRFNAADLAILAGAVMMVLMVLLHPDLRSSGAGDELGGSQPDNGGVQDAAQPPDGADSSDPGSRER